jgi:cation diffusion facilitator family transporter
MSTDHPRDHVHDDRHCHGDEHEDRHDHEPGRVPYRHQHAGPGVGQNDNDGVHSHHDDDHEHDHDRSGVHEFVASIFRPHSHDAADSIDAALEASRDGMRALKVSFAVLAITAVVQVMIVAASGSVALLSDTIHNFADALTAVPLGLAFWLGRRPATKRYTYGYGRSEDLAGVFIVATIAISSALAAYEAVNRLVHPHRVHQVAWVIVAGIVGFAGNELVAVYRIRTGRRIGSAALVADGLHARTDGFTSLAVVVGAIGVAAGWQLADPIVGLVITLAILVVVKNAAWDIYRRLMDAVDSTLVEQVTAILSGVEGIDSVDAVRIRWIGHQLHAEAEVTSDGKVTLAQAHDVAEHARHHLLHEVPRLAQATIHSSPARADGLDPHALTAHHFTHAPPAEPAT